MTAPLRPSPVGAAARTCVVLDDSPFTLHSITAMLEQQSLVVVGEFSSAVQTLKSFQVGTADVAIIDLHLGKRPSGIDVALTLRECDPELGILFMSACSDRRLAGDPLSRIPANTVHLTKDDITGSAVLAEAAQLAHRLAKGEKRRDVREGRAGHAGPVRTDTQAETLRLVARGHSNREIARIRVVTERAVERSTSRLLRQFNIASNADVSPRVLLAAAYWRLHYPTGVPDSVEYLDNVGDAGDALNLQ